MKKKDLQQLKEQSLESLKKMVLESGVKINSLRSEIYAGREKNVKSAKNERIKRAITKTIIREKEQEGRGKGGKE